MGDLDRPLKQCGWRCEAQGHWHLRQDEAVSGGAGELDEGWAICGFVVKVARGGDPSGKSRRREQRVSGISA